MKEQHYCFDISFPTVQFDSYLTSTERPALKHHAHLFVRDSEIELRIFYESKTYFGRKLSDWVSKINWKDFGSYSVLENESQNENIQKIDLHNSQLLQLTTGTDQFENNHEYVKILLDSVKFYWNPREEKINTAEFYFNDAGFHVVQDYYYPLSGDQGEFNISLRDDSKEYYKINHGTFKPEFHFWKKDHGSFREATIVKEPKIQFVFTEDISESEVTHYAEMIRLLSSFYYSLNIDYVFSRIHLKDHTITVKKVGVNEKVERAGNLWGFRYYFDFKHFLKTNWETFAKSNFKKLHKAIEMYLQSHFVDSSSRFLIRYNIIEVCMSGTKMSGEKFTQILEEKEVAKKYSEALTLLLQTIAENDHSEFCKKWEGVPTRLSYKPMKSPLLKFLQDQGLNPESFPISIDSLKEMRDNITHGSIDKIKSKELERANILLYRISGILILNLLGIKDWNFNGDLPD